MNNELHKIINESVHNVLREYLEKDYGVPLYHAAKEHLEEVGVVKNEWLIHFADSDDIAEKIMQTSFSNGLSKDELDYHSLTWAQGKHEDKGYSWAFKANSFIDDEESPWGTCILFQGSGIEYYNEVDCNTQVIFYGKNAYNKILIYEWNGGSRFENKYEDYGSGLYGVGNINGKPLFIGEFNEVVKWCIVNFHQYRRLLLSNTEILIPSDDEERGYEDYLDSVGYSELPQDSINIYNKWYSVDDYQKDYTNYSNQQRAAYEEFLEANKAKIDDIKRKAMEYANIIIKTNKSHFFNESQIEKLVDSFTTNLMDAEHLSWNDFIQEYQRNHAFYMRKRQDGNYWKYKKAKNESKDMKAKTVIFTESDIKNIVMESVQRILGESVEDMNTLLSQACDGILSMGGIECNREASYVSMITSDEMEMVERGEYPVIWTIYLNGREFRSPHCFDTVEEAEAECEEILKKIRFYDIAKMNQKSFYNAVATKYGEDWDEDDVEFEFDDFGYDDELVTASIGCFGYFDDYYENSELDFDVELSNDGFGFYD